MQSIDLTNIDKLKSFIDGCSKAELKNVEPRVVANRLGISIEEADNMLSSLVESNEATRYILFECPGEDCDEDIIVDYDDLNEKTECELCNKTFIPNDIVESYQGIFYEIVKDYGVNKNTYDEVDFKAKYLKKNNDVQNKVVEIFSQKNILGEDKINGNIKTLKEENQSKIDKESVFIVHGRDNEAKTEVARYIERFGLKPIILHEKASGGKTIIEKIESYSNVGYAIVLYTPCDVGALKGEESDLKPRARQNVIFEHGYLYGKIGRNNVCALVKSDVDKPNDMAGVVYIDMDRNGGWKIEVARELIESGYNIDMNKI